MTICVRAQKNDFDLAEQKSFVSNNLLTTKFFPLLNLPLHHAFVLFGGHRQNCPWYFFFTNIYHYLPHRKLFRPLVITWSGASIWKSVYFYKKWIDACHCFKGSQSLPNFQHVLYSSFISITKAPLDYWKLSLEYFINYYLHVMKLRTIPGCRAWKIRSWGSKSPKIVSSIKFLTFTKEVEQSSAKKQFQRQSSY